jgi:hypothetical protein
MQYGGVAFLGNRPTRAVAWKNGRKMMIVMMIWLKKFYNIFMTADCKQLQNKL